MEDFVKTTSGPLTGIQKAAILLAEIGPSRNDEYNKVFENLHLSSAQLKRLRIVMQSLKPYLQPAPGDINEIYREQQVLREALNYGRQKGFEIPDEKPLEPATSATEKSEISKLSKNDPKAVAKLLSSWLE